MKKIIIKIKIIIIMVKMMILLDLLDEGVEVFCGQFFEFDFTAVRDGEEDARVDYIRVD